MVVFLSNDWDARMDELLRSATTPDDLPTVTIEQRVDLGESVFTYQIMIAADGCSAATGPAESPTITYVQTHETAMAIARQQRSAHEAFMLGQLRLEGNPNELAEALPALTWLGDVLAPLREETEFGDEAHEPTG